MLTEHGTETEAKREYRLLTSIVLKVVQHALITRDDKK